jgi:hypothetical protein
LKISIPIGQPGTQGFQSNRKGTSGPHSQYTVRGKFVDRYSNGSLLAYIDGTQAFSLDLSSLVDANGNPISTAGPSGSSTLPNGATVQYSSTVSATSLTVTGQINISSGVSHSFGAVETNGDCLYIDGSPCLGDPGYSGGLNKGFVLAEGQTSFTLQPNSTANVTLTLAEVIEAGYICYPDAVGCDQSVTLDASAPSAIIYGFPVDETGDTITGSNDKYSNGPWQFVETDGEGIVTLSNPGPFSNPNPGPYGTSGKTWDHQATTVSCNKTGTATLQLHLSPGTPSKGTVAGFSYTSENYPASGSHLSKIGGTEFYGTDAFTVNCAVNGTANFTIN